MKSFWCFLISSFFRQLWLQPNHVFELEILLDILLKNCLDLKKQIYNNVIIIIIICSLYFFAKKKIVKWY